MYKHSKRQKERDKLKLEWEKHERLLQGYNTPAIKSVEEEKKLTIEKKGVYIDEKV